MSVGNPLLPKSWQEFQNLSYTVKAEWTWQPANNWSRVGPLPLSTRSFKKSSLWGRIYDLNRGLDFENLPHLVTTRARRFCTPCKLVLWFLWKKMQKSRRLLRELAREMAVALIRCM